MLQYHLGPSRICSIRVSRRSKDRSSVNQWVELSGGMTCLYKLMAPTAAPEHVMVATNVFTHHFKSLFLFACVCVSISHQESLYHRQCNSSFNSCFVLLNFLSHNHAIAFNQMFQASCLVIGSLDSGGLWKGVSMYWVMSDSYTLSF